MKYQGKYDPTAEVQTVSGHEPYTEPYIVMVRQMTDMVHRVHGVHVFIPLF